MLPLFNAFSVHKGMLHEYLHVMLVAEHKRPD